jgi:Protein of unknown function (DUF4235)
VWRAARASIFTVMRKLFFMPFGVVGGLVAGALGRRVFGTIWGVIDEEAPPEPEQRRVSIGKLALALALDGAVVRVVRGLVDHGSRRGFQRLTGLWPGKEDPEPEPRD